ncbi:MAG: hypothetical protein ACM359_18560, partial [Bacillota bacterium]
LDGLLTDYLSQELDNQLGRAASRFQQVSQANNPRRIPWLAIAGPAAAIAASLAVVWILHALHRPTASPPSAGDRSNQVTLQNDPSAQPLELQRAIAWQTLDDGTVMLDDDTPVRQLRQQVLKYVRWYDPQQQATVELAVPQEQVFLVEMKSY